MDDFIAKNKILLLFYYWTARIGSWVYLAIASATVIGHTVALASRIGTMDEFYRYWQHDVPWGMVNDVLPTGLLALGISQLIWYLLETDHKARWILRHAHHLLYLYTAILVGCYCWAGIADLRVHFTEPHDFPFRMILISTFILVKLLALIGVAEILRRMLPVIEESRTLV